LQLTFHANHLSPKGFTLVSDTPSSQDRPLWKNPFVIGAPILLIVALYSGWIVFSRWNENRQIEERAKAAAAQKRSEEDRLTVEAMGYGVANAKTVALDPPAGPMWPSYGRCIDVKPNKTTTYTLTASDAAGHSVSQTFTIKVD
jgi:hypothetical protein